MFNVKHHTKKHYTYYGVDIEDAPTIGDEVREQIQEVFHFRNVEHLPIERSYE